MALKSYKTQSIIVTVISGLMMCCYCAGTIPLVLGILGIVNSNKAESLFAAGDIAGAESAAKNAKTFSLIASIFIGLSILGFIAYIFIYGVTMAAFDPAYYY
tara:strand:+ start:5350 stop:5655 length:306 start_codon:yes stop_codon:yes gene_type:complete